LAANGHEERKRKDFFVFFLARQLVAPSCRAAALAKAEALAKVEASAAAAVFSCGQGEC